MQKIPNEWVRLSDSLLGKYGDGKARREKSDAKLREPYGLPSKAEIKKKFKEQMAQFATDAASIENEELRGNLSRCIEATLRALPDYRDLHDLLEFVQSSTDTLRMGLARGLNGHRDPRTQKIIEKAEEQAMDRAMLADHRRQ
jgi:hypothetical protein